MSKTLQDQLSLQFCAIFFCSVLKTKDFLLCYLFSLMNGNYLLLNICAKLTTVGLSFLLSIATTPSMITPVKLISSSLSLEISAFSPFAWISVIVGKVMKKWNSASMQIMFLFHSCSLRSCRCGGSLETSKIGNF